VPEPELELERNNLVRAKLWVCGSDAPLGISTLHSGSWAHEQFPIAGQTAQLCADSGRWEVEGGKSGGKFCYLWSIGDTALLAYCGCYSIGVRELPAGKTAVVTRQLSHIPSPIALCCQSLTTLAPMYMYRSCQNKGTREQGNGRL
jgi:hypothetical protein